MIEKRSDLTEEKLMRIEDLSSNMMPKEKAPTSNQLLVKDGASSLVMLGRKLLFHVHIVGFAVAFLDVFLESKKYKKIGRTMDIKVA